MSSKDIDSMQEPFCAASSPACGRGSAEGNTLTLPNPKTGGVAPKSHSRFHVLDGVATTASATHEVLVYGSLLPGLHNHSILQGSRFLGYHQTYPQFEMFSLGHFPAVCTEGQTAICGALYRVDDVTLGRLDRLESHPRWYRRERVDLVPSDSAPAVDEAWMYLMPRTEPEVQNGLATPVPSGDWFAFHNQRQAEALARVPKANNLHAPVASPFALAG